MASFIIEGGHLLQGTIIPQGAKNEALEVICATLLSEEAVTIENIPDIRQQPYPATQRHRSKSEGWGQSRHLYLPSRRFGSQVS